MPRGLKLFLARPCISRLQRQGGGGLEMENTNSHQETSKTGKTLTRSWDPEKYIRMYHLADLVEDDNLRSNLLSYFRLRDQLSDLYNESYGHGEMKQVWLANILVLDSSIIEGLLTACVKRVESNCDRINCKKKNNCPHLRKKRFFGQLAQYHFGNITEDLSTWGILTIDRTKIDEIRELRNNIHIAGMDFNLEKSNKYSATSITNANELILVICKNLYKHLFLMKVQQCMR